MPSSVSSPTPASSSGASTFFVELLCFASSGMRAPRSEAVVSFVVVLDDVNENSRLS
jgi:hypothetical protein